MTTALRPTATIAAISLAFALMLAASASTASAGQTVVAGGEQTRPAWTRNCTTLNRRFKHGVGMPGARDKTSDEPVTNFRRSRALYQTAMRWNKGLDRDKDKIACEKH
jgi:Excalibur calcium-binding domain